MDTIDTSTGATQKNNLLVPGAIVLAGIIVAIAIIFSGGSTPKPGSPTALSPEDVDVKKLSSDDHVLGDPNAEVTIIEYSDLECPYCQTFHETMNQIMDKYGKDGKVSWVYRHFWSERKMADGNIFHPRGGVSAEASECVAEISGNQKFFEYLDLIFRGQPASLNNLEGLATTIGIDATKFKTCTTSKKYAKKVQDLYEEGKASGVSGTPTSFIVTKKGIYPVEGAMPYSDFEQVVEAALNE